MPLWCAFPLRVWSCGVWCWGLCVVAWLQVVSRFLALQNTGRYRVAIYTSDVTAHDIAR